VIDKVNPSGNTGGGLNATVGQMSQLLQVDDVMVGNTFYNTSEEGQAQSLTRAWGDSVLVYYAPDRPSIDRPSFGYSFRWSAPNIANLTVERHPFDPRTKMDSIEVGYYQDEVITSSVLGALVTNVTSST